MNTTMTVNELEAAQELLKNRDNQKHSMPLSLFPIQQVVKGGLRCHVVVQIDVVEIHVEEIIRTKTSVIKDVNDVGVLVVSADSAN